MSAFGSFGGNQGSGGFGFGSNAQQQQQQQQQPQQQQQSGGIFGGGFGSTPAAGGASGQQNTMGGTSLFGSSAQNTGVAGGGAFGNTNQQQPGGGLFGGASAQQPAAGGGLFGSTQTNTGGGLFGSAGQTNTSAPGTTTGGGLFSSTAPGQGANTFGIGGSFGNIGSWTGTTSGQGTTGGLFGASTNAPSTTGGGLFSNTGSSTGTAGLFSNTGTGTGGLFGGSSNTGTTGTSGGLFGSTTGTSGAGTGGGLFGGSLTSTAAPSSGLFSQTQTTQPSLFGQTRPAGSLFGQPAQQQPTQGNLFGQPQQQQQQPQGSLFGSLSQPPGVGNSLFGGSTLGSSNLLGSTANLFASRAPIAPAQQPDPRSQFIALVQRIDSIKQAWDPSSPQCQFQHFFYNLVDPAQVHLYGRPANATNDAAWQKAVRENPDPSCLVPVLAVGLDDLQQRVDAQTRQAAEHQEKLKELKTRIETLSQRHQLTNVSRLARASALQTQLTHRVLKVVQHLHLLIPALRSSSIRPEEEVLRAALEDIDEEIRRPGGMGKMRGKLNELWALVDAVRAARERGRQDGYVEWAVVDEEGLSQIAQILAEEQAGLAHVTKILQKDLKDLAVIQGIPVKQEEPDALSGSVSALRGSLIR